MILRDAGVGDAQFIWQCRAELGRTVALAAGGGQDYAAHLAWMNGAVEDPQRLFLVPEEDGVALGYVRFDPSVEGWRTSLCVASAACGKGIGFKVLQLACAMAKERRFVPIFADIHEVNSASITVFLRAGFTLAGPTPGMLGYHRHWLFIDLKDQIHA